MTEVTKHRAKALGWAAAAFAGLFVAVGVWSAGRDWRGTVSAADPQTTSARQGAVTVARRDFVRAVRLSGTVEAIESTTIAAPRLSGPNTQSLVITRLVRPGSTVQAGDLVVEFDRQQQLTNALDRRAELADLEQQIRKREAQERAAAAKDDSEIKVAESSVSRAELEMLKNDMIPRINAEKNTLALEQASAKLEQLRTTFKLKRDAAAADLRILEIRRARAQKALEYAEKNAELMQIRSPFAGLVVVKTMYRPGAGYVEILEGDEGRPGMPVIDVVDTSAMLVRSRVNQADGEYVRVGQPATIRLDGFPELVFKGRVEHVTPLAIGGYYSSLLRAFTAIISIDGTHAQLLPDLTASVEVVPPAPTPTVAPAGGRQ
jgi:multidrug efflux pump subunit AcrA (membrane-fusion protein)